MKRLSDPGLARTQRWMQAFILAEGEDQAALMAPQVQAEIPGEEALKLVLPSLTLTPLERVGIYRSMYLSRLGEALETDYPALLHFLGQEGFYSLAARYLDAYPSRSYTLNRLGDHLPEFIRAQTDLPKAEFLHDLARLELALTEVFDEQESPALRAEAIAALSPEAWETAILKPVAAFRLLAFRYPVSEYIGAVDQENAFPQNRRKPSFVAAYRKNYNVHRLDLSRRAFQLLKALAAGTPVGQAVADSQITEKQLFQWFRDWTGEGFFQTVECPAL